MIIRDINLIFQKRRKENAFYQRKSLNQRSLLHLRKLLKISRLRPEKQNPMMTKMEISATLSAIPMMIIYLVECQTSLPSTKPLLQDHKHLR